MKSPYDPIEEKDQDRPDRRAEWNQRGRTAPPGQSAAALRLRAHRQKMAMRAAREAAAKGGGAGAEAPTATSWVGLGPAPLVSDSNTFGTVSGRATSVAIDPSDATGNTVYLGGAYGGVWKSINAAAAPASSVVWTPVTDQQPTLATGAVSVKPTGGVVLVGTGEPNSALDSYYGAGILRSTNGGTTWGPIISGDVGGNSFVGSGFTKFAWSTAQTSTVVASTAQAFRGVDEGKINPNTTNGLYLSTDSGLTWAYQSPTDGSAPISVTDVVYNASAGKFFAAIRYHGVYSSTNGTSWTRLTAQPSAVLTLTNCPTSTNPNTCPMYRGQLAVVPGRNEMYFWFVDGNDTDRGIWRSTNGGGAWTQISESGLTVCGDPFGCGTQQAFYNLEIAAVADGSATDLYAGTINLYKCKLASGATTCSQLDAGVGAKWINLTHVYGCPSIAGVHPDEHGLDFIPIASGSKLILYFANDGGVYRALDGFTDLLSGSCGKTNQFDDLNATLGSMTQFVSFSIHPTDQNTVLGGTQDNGSPATITATSNSQWTTANGGDGGFNAINPTNTSQWFAANTGVSVQVCNTAPSCTSGDFISVVSEGQVGGDFGPFYTPYILDPQNSSEMLVGTCRVWRGTATAGSFSTLSVNFDTLSNTLCNGGEVNQVHALAAGGPLQNGFSNVVYATTEGYGPFINIGGGEVWVTTNAATTPMLNVTASINPLNYPISSVAIDNSDSTGRTAFVGIMGFGVSHVFKTTNAGGAWTDWNGTGLPDAPVNALLVDSTSHIVYAGTDVGVFASPTSSAIWSEVGPAAQPGATGYLPNVPVSAIRLFSATGVRKLRVSTYGRGIWEFDLTAIPDYQIAISNTPLKAFPNQTATFNGILTAFSTYNSPVNLSCTGTTPGPCTFLPSNSITPTAGGTAFSVSLNSGGAITNYNFNVHGVGTDAGTTTHDAPVVLQLEDFTLGNPGTITVQQGGTSNTAPFQVSALGGFAQSVTLSCSGLPLGASCNFSPSNTVSPTVGNPVTVNLTISTTNSTPVGSFPITLSGLTAGEPAKTQSFTLTVTPVIPDFSLSLTATPNTTLANQNVTWNGVLTSINGYSNTVNLSCTAGAPGTCTITPPSIVLQSGMGVGFLVKVGSATTGTFNFSIQATDGTITHSQPASLTVNTDVAVPATLADTAVQPGQTATTSMNLMPIGAAAFSGTVTYVCSGLPAGLQCAFNPPQIAAGGAATNVGISIATAGPFTGTQRKIHSQNNRLWLPLTLPLAGVVLAGLAGRGLPRRFSIIGLCVALVLTGFLVACGGGGGGAPPPPVISVTVSPNPVNNLYPNLNGAPPQTQQFTATVHNSGNQNVTWAVAGGAANGTIDLNGLYTAPGAVPAGAVTVTATAQADATKSGNATVNIKTPTPPGTSHITVTVTEATQPQAQHPATFDLMIQ